ncbi:MAG TPA: glucan biosynthesis protein G [Verrucomicrobiales bacterium]|nr:glucan biosynthesis protein G [Verrucomicrobiales bacterium]
MLLSAAFLAALDLHAADPGPEDVTDFPSLEAHAQALARAAHVPVEQDLDSFFAKLNYDGHRRIRFREDKALFGGAGDTFRVEFFHPGWMFKKPVRFHQITDEKAEPVGFDSGLFDYGGLEVPTNAGHPSGYAGFRVLAPDSFLDRRFEFLVFMGASYYRAVTTELGYGISARGIAVNTVGGAPEEFPDFTRFWLARPKPGDDTFRLLALLDGPSLAGAYEFSAKPGRTTEMRVRGTLFLRQKVEMLGIAPFSSMFWYGENSHPKPYDFRPEVHDSDGLQIEIENGPAIWRPLDVGRETRMSFFQAEKLKGFGLAGRDRDFANFQDLEARYHQRPSVWVEPVAGFDKGAVVLVELPTGEETWDNIVAMWKPESVPQTPDEALRFDYKLLWHGGHEPGGLCKVAATRRGFVMDSDDHLYVLDFEPGMAERGKAAEWTPEARVRVNAGAAEVLDARVMRNAESGGWRAFFKLDVPADTALLELICELHDGPLVISERWQYQWRR